MLEAGQKINIEMNNDYFDIAEKGHYLIRANYKRIDFETVDRNFVHVRIGDEETETSENYEIDLRTATVTKKLGGLRSHNKIKKEEKENGDKIKMP